MGNTPCHATLTETLRAIDGRALADALGAVCFVEGGDQRHITIDGKTMRASKDGDGNATHVLSAFCAGLQSILGNEASRGKGMEIPDALKLLDRLDLKGRIVTGDAMFCQKSIVTNRDIPATNNGSERALRPCVVFRKITNGFRTEWGAKLYADIRSVIETARRRSIGALEAIRLTLAGASLVQST